jgi:hypothetical protein
VTSNSTQFMDEEQWRSGMYLDEGHFAQFTGKIPE